MISCSSEESYEFSKCEIPQTKTDISPVVHRMKGVYVSGRRVPAHLLHVCLVVPGWLPSLLARVGKRGSTCVYLGLVVPRASWWAPGWWAEGRGGGALCFYLIGVSCVTTTKCYLDPRLHLRSHDQHYLSVNLIVEVTFTFMIDTFVLSHWIHCILNKTVFYLFIKRPQRTHAHSKKPVSVAL